MLVARARSTNVVCSYFSGSLNAALIDYLISEDMDAVRLIAEKDDLSAILEFSRNLRTAFPAHKRPVPIMLDALAKPQAIVHGLSSPREIDFGEKLTVGQVSTKAELQLETQNWEGLFNIGAQVFFGYGYVAFKVAKIENDIVLLECIQGGVIQPAMNVYVPATQKLAKFADLASDLDAIVKHQLDYLVVPAFESVDDLIAVKRRLDDSPAGAPWLFLKINAAHSYHNLAELLPHVRGVVISRLELAMTMDPAQVPMVTKEVIQSCNDQAKVVLVASEMLASMRHNATPTRAEVSDIANAVMDGADGVILSEDLPYGAFARRGLQIARATIADIEQSSAGRPLNWIKHERTVDNELAAVTYTAYRTAQRNHAKAIVCITKSGNTALHLASFRQSIPIIAVTLSAEIQRRLSLIRGVTGFHLENAPGIAEVLPVINERLVTDSWLKRGDKIVFVSVTISSVGHEASNLFTVQTLY